MALNLGNVPRVIGRIYLGNRICCKCITISFDEFVSRESFCNFQLSAIGDCRRKFMFPDDSICVAMALDHRHAFVISNK